MHISRARNPLRLLIAMVALLAIAALAGSASSARADGLGPITFESTDGYAVGNINGQNGWSNTGGFDANVAAVSSFPAASGYGFGGQALQISDSVTSGTFGNQTFAPALTQPAGEATPQRFFNASFKIGTTQATQRCVGCTAGDPPVANPLHMSVSPDNGSGGRMSYLRFEDQADGVHVFFDDVTDSGPDPTPATFNETDIATLSRTSSHTIGFSIQFIPGPGNDVVKVTIDGVLKATGTTWEDYYRYDNEGQGGTNPPTTSTLEFRESGDQNASDAGKGFLIDNVSTTSSTTVPCYSTGFIRDGIDLTAAQIGGNVTGALDASGCNVGVYYDSTHTGNVTGANIHGANYYGVVVNGDAGAVTTNVKTSTIHDIGETPLNGTQHGNAIYYRALGTGTATGVISGNTITNYQKGGITANGKVTATITNNHVTGQGPVDYIAQNGIQIGYGAKASVTGNTVTGNAYTGANNASSGGILVVGGPCFGLPYTTGLTISNNTLTGNDVGVWLFNGDASCNAPATKTNNVVKFNTISNGAVTNTTGESPTCGYQAGVSDLGVKDQIVNNKISGFGYKPTVGGDCTGTHPAFLRFIDAGSSARGVNSNK
jgi:hypothetical protein